jgi:signal transduction histidine kinase
MLESGTVGDINPQQSQFVSKILSGISQMASLVENVQDAGRYDPETGFYEMRRSPCDVVEIAQKIVNSHLVPAEKQELSIAVTFSEAVPVINADTTMIERAITNLIDNAIKYTPNGGKVEVVIRSDGENVIFGVSDTGLGISPDNRKQLFERHVRIPRTEHKRIKGSGLGLFIVRSVAQRHGGRAWVESTEGKGSTFFFSIPLHGPNGATPL